MKRIFICLFIISLFFNSCIVVKHEGKDERIEIVNLSPKPEIPMSEDIVRSKMGDMIAFIPKDWFFIDVEDRASSEIFAVAVSPDYTLSAVFSHIRSNSMYDEIVEREGLMGLARISFEKHQKKTAGAVKQVGYTATINMGQLTFARFNMLSSPGAMPTKAAVFISSVNQYYEFALMPMDFRGKPLPTPKEFDTIFNSILATVQY